MPHEIAACHPYLAKQIELINPEIIVTLGRLAMAEFLGPGLSITRVHGEARAVNGRLVVPLLHPAAALRQERYRQDLERDFAVLRRILDEGVEPPSEAEDKPSPGAVVAALEDAGASLG